nr:MAG TPA: hypothetical protein [Caudoviricetes sp.]
MVQKHNTMGRDILSLPFLFVFLDNEVMFR